MRARVGKGGPSSPQGRLGRPTRTPSAKACTHTHKHASAGPLRAGRSRRRMSQKAPQKLFLRSGSCACGRRWQTLADAGRRPGRRCKIQENSWQTLILIKCQKPPSSLNEIHVCQDLSRNLQRLPGRLPRPLPTSARIYPVIHNVCQDVCQGVCRISRPSRFARHHLFWRRRCQTTPTSCNPRKLPPDSAATRTKSHTSPMRRAREINPSAAASARQL